MSGAALTASLTDALMQAAAGADLVSITVDVLTSGEAARVEATLVRKTRTLAFVSAEAFDAGGMRLAVAASVHRLSA